MKVVWHSNENIPAPFSSILQMNTSHVSVMCFCLTAHHRRHHFHKHTHIWITTDFERLNQEKKLPHLAKKKVYFYHEDTLVPISAVTMTKIHEMMFELLELSSYSYIPKLQKITRKTFREQWSDICCEFVELDESFYKNGIMALEHYWANFVKFSFFLPLWSFTIDYTYLILSIYNQ